MEERREHGEKIAILETQLVGVHAKLDEIIGLVRATNGRVRKLEIWRAIVTGGVLFTLTVMSGAFALAKWILP